MKLSALRQALSDALQSQLPTYQSLEGAAVVDLEAISELEVMVMPSFAVCLGHPLLAIDNPAKKDQLTLELEIWLFEEISRQHDFADSLLKTHAHFALRPALIAEGQNYTPTQVGALTPHSPAIMRSSDRMAAHFSIQFKVSGE